MWYDICEIYISLKLFFVYRAIKNVLCQEVSIGICYSLKNTVNDGKIIILCNIFLKIRGLEVK